MIFNLSLLCIRKFCYDFDIFVMNGTLLHVTGQYVACFVLLCFNQNFLLDDNIQNVDTFYRHNLTAQNSYIIKCHLM